MVQQIQTMYEKVIVPLDGSPMAEVALPYAEEIAGKMGSNIILLSVLPSEEPQEYQKHHDYTTKIVNITRRKVDKYLEDPELIDRHAHPPTDAPA